VFTQSFEFALEAITEYGEAALLLGLAQEFVDALGITAVVQAVRTCSGCCRIKSRPNTWTIKHSLVLRAE